MNGQCGGFNEIHSTMNLIFVMMMMMVMIMMPLLLLLLLLLLLWMTIITTKKEYRVCRKHLASRYMRQVLLIAKATLAATSPTHKTNFDTFELVSIFLNISLISMVV